MSVLKSVCLRLIPALDLRFVSRQFHFTLTHQKPGSQAYSKMAARDARQPAPWRIVGEVSCLLQSNPEVGEL